MAAGESSPPDTEKFPKVERVLRPDLRLRLKENFDRFKFSKFTRRSKWQNFANGF